MLDGGVVQACAPAPRSARPARARLRYSLIAPLETPVEAEICRWLSLHSS